MMMRPIRPSLALASPGYHPSSTATTVVGCTAVVVLGAFYFSRKSSFRSTTRRWFSLPPFSSSEYFSTRKSSSSKDVGDSTTSNCIYLDYNGTTPVHSLVLAAMLPFLSTHFGNPSSSHAFGLEPKLAVEAARQSILTNLLLDPSDRKSSEPTSSIWFTSCGTESDNCAIQVALQSTPRISPRKHIVTSNVEHPAIEVCLKNLEDVDVTYVPVGTDGRVSADDVIRAIRLDTVLVTVMLANNESGALQPIKPIAEYCRTHGILCHTDAAQAVGKVSVRLSDLGYPDMMTIVGHKMGAPKGIAALYVRDGCYNENGRKLDPGKPIVLMGGGQEFGRRGGTENVPYIVGLGKASELVGGSTNLLQNSQHMEVLRCRLLQNLEEALGGQDRVRANGPVDPSHRLPNTLSVGIRGIESGILLSEIGSVVAASAGAACHSSSDGSSGISSVLRAMQVPTEFARGTLRLTVGPTLTLGEVDRASQIIVDAVKRQWEPTSAQ